MALIRRRIELEWMTLLPPEIVGHFTQGQRAVLTIIADDHRQHGICRAHIDDLTIRAACTVSSVKAAISEAIRLGFLARDEQGALMIMSAEWLAFISESSVDRRRDRYAADVQRFV
jgi:hypothetical protein